MKPQLCPSRGTRGSTLVMVLILSVCTLLVLASTLDWTSTNTTLAFRNNEYYRTIAVAEAATEKVIARIQHDYQLYGDAATVANTNLYKGLVPTTTDNPIFSSYAFNNGLGVQSNTYVVYMPPTAFRVLTAQYRGLYGYSSRFRIISNARETTSRFNITGAVAQDVEVATIPLFQFAIFYNIDLEINPGPVMTVTGPVHSNQKIYLCPGATLTFRGDVTSAMDIYNSRKEGDPQSCSSSSSNLIVYPPGVEHDSGVSSLNLPIGTNNSPTAVRQVVEIPPTGEDTNSAMGLERFYNKADIIVRVTDTATNVHAGLFDNFATAIPRNQWTNWLDPYESFFNKRENKNVNAVQIDVGKLRTFSMAANGTNSNQNVIKNKINTSRGGTNSEVMIVFVKDERTPGASVPANTQPGVRVVNGSLLPPKGLTIATPNPLYVWGNYNVRTNTIDPPVYNSTNTSKTLPAALIGDAITVLSTNWSDSVSLLNLDLDDSRRNATATSVNAAFLAGILDTVSGSYSGGVENFPRFLEDWAGVNFQYNGSMVVMYNSEYATGLWRGTGNGYDIYNPPTRNWAFDQNFKDPTKLPPGTPTVRTMVRTSWAMIKPNSTNMIPVMP